MRGFFGKIMGRARERIRAHGLGGLRPEKLFSLKVLIASGFVVAMVPLFFAIMYAAIAMGDTTALGETAIHQAMEQAKTARSIVERVSDIERKAKLFVLLADPHLRQPYERESYENVRASLSQSLSELRAMRVDSRITLLADELAEKERLIYEQIMASETDNAVRLPVDEAFKGLHSAALALWQEVVNRVDRQVAELRGQSEAVQRLFLIKGAALLVISVVFLAALLAVLTRSIRQLDTAIRRMGAGNFAARVSVTGPLDLRQLGDQLDWLRGRLLALEESKQQFMRTVCGEIEKPLARVCESSASIEAGHAFDAGPERRETSAVLVDNVHKLKALFEELIRYSRANESPLRDARKDVNMKMLLESVLEAHQKGLQAKSLTVRRLLQPVALFGAADQLRTVVDNLISNAVKFSPAGGEIRVMLRAAGDQLELEVEDDGPGIDADERSQVFEPFYRGKAARAMETEGSGLGLAIVNECVVNHHGRIDIVEPRQDEHGARIRVQLPLLEAV